jgi:hypothetical protein
MLFAAPLAYLNTSIFQVRNIHPPNAIGGQASPVWARDLKQRSNYVTIAPTSQELQASTKLELARHGGLLPSQCLGVSLSVRPRSNGKSRRQGLESYTAGPVLGNCNSAPSDRGVARARPTQRYPRYSLYESVLML